MEDLIKAQHDELERLRGMRSKRNLELLGVASSETPYNNLQASAMLGETTPPRKSRQDRRVTSTQRMPEATAVSRSVALLESARKEDVSNWQRRVKSTDDFLTESHFTLTPDRISKSFHADMGGAPKTLKERENFYASRRIDLEWADDLKKSICDARDEGVSESKYEEVQRELFNTVETLEGERIEANRVKNELVQRILEVEDLREMNAQLEEKAKEAAASNKLCPSVEEVQKEAREAKMNAEAVIISFKEKAAVMQKAWDEEKGKIRSELAKVVACNQEIRGGLALLEEERDKFKKISEEAAQSGEEMKGRVEALEQKLAEVENERDLYREKCEKAHNKDKRMQETMASISNIGAKRGADERSGQHQSAQDLALTLSGDALAVEEEEREIMQVIADMNQDDIDLPPPVPPPAPPKTMAAKKLLQDFESRGNGTEEASGEVGGGKKQKATGKQKAKPKPRVKAKAKTKAKESDKDTESADADSDGGADTDADADSVKSIEWVASASQQEQEQDKPPPVCMKTLKLINSRPKIRIDPQKPSRMKIPKSSSRSSSKKRSKGKKKSLSRSPKSPKSPPIPPRPHSMQENGQTAATLSSNDSRRDDSPMTRPLRGENDAVTVEVPYLIAPPVLSRERLPNHLVATKELQMKYRRVNTPEKKIKRKKRTIKSGSMEHRSGKGGDRC